jgi:hypothetical protein
MQYAEIMGAKNSRLSVMQMNPESWFRHELL